MGVNQYYRSTMGEIPLASPMEPETTRAILNYNRRPKVVDQLNINDWVRGLKAAAGLPYGVDNLGSVYDVAYLFGVANRRNAKIDFVTGTLKAEEVVGYEHLITFDSKRGFVGNNTSTAVDTKWNVNRPGNKGTPTGYHWHSCCLESNTDARTHYWNGTLYFHSVPLQSISGNNVFRIRSGSSALNNFPNSDVKGSYTIKKIKDTNQVSYQKNNAAEQFASNSGSSFPDENFYVLGINTGGIPNSLRVGMLTGSFTAGSKNVNGELLAKADRDYFLNYGIDLFDTE